MLRVAHRVENGASGHDRVLVEYCGDRTFAIVADGAGGMGGGAVAAEMTCSLAAEMMRTSPLASPAAWERRLLDIDRALVRHASGGQCTAVAVELSGKRVIGASVGDSGAWLLDGPVARDLTKLQHRKPLLGSGEASPLGFGPVDMSGLLLLATDGLLKYAKHHDVVRQVRGVPLDVAIDNLVAGLRLRSGALQDDVGIVLLEDSA